MGGNLFSIKGKREKGRQAQKPKRGGGVPWKADSQEWARQWPLLFSRDMKTHREGSGAKEPAKLTQNRPLTNLCDLEHRGGEARAWDLG